MLKLILFLCFTVNVLVDSIPLEEPVIEGRIIGGKDTDITQVPYLVGLNIYNLPLCGGFIISPTHVVTAGQCVFSIPLSEITFRAGSTSKKGGLIVKPKKIHVHPKYNAETLDYDVAVVELATPLKIDNKTMKPIKLAAKEPSAGSPVMVSGWGYVSENNAETDVIRSVTIPVYDRADCVKEYSIKDQDITSRMICAAEKYKMAYYNDNGGPLVYKDEVVGIVSFGFEDLRYLMPGVYTNIANPEITKFIKDIAKV